MFAQMKWKKTQNKMETSFMSRVKRKGLKCKRVDIRVCSVNKKHFEKPVWTCNIIIVNKHANF